MNNRRKQRGRATAMLVRAEVSPSRAMRLWGDLLTNDFLEGIERGIKEAKLHPLIKFGEVQRRIYTTTDGIKVRYSFVDELN